MTPRRRSIATLAAVVLLFPLRSSYAKTRVQTRAPAHRVNSCALLTDARIKTVLGSPVQPGQPTVTPEKSECAWKDAKGETRVYLSVKDAGIEYKSFRDQMQATGKMVPVTGLAEDAFYIASSGSSAALYALKAKHLVLIAVDGVGASKADNEGAEKALVSELLPKL